MRAAPRAVYGDQDPVGHPTNTHARLGHGVKGHGIMYALRAAQIVSQCVDALAALSSLPDLSHVCLCGGRSCVEN